MAGRLNGGGTHFDRTAENLKHATHVRASGETLRQLIEGEGRQVLEAFRQGTLPITWTAQDCAVEPGRDGSPTRLYLGCDGVMAPTATDAEKGKRRENAKGKRRRPLRRAKAGADQKYEEFELVTYYDEDVRHRLVLGTKGNCDEAGRLMRRLAARIDLAAANEKVGNVDGAPWIRGQVEGRNLPLDGLGLDFYRLSEQVHKGRRTVFGETTPAGMVWAGEVLHAFKHDGYEAAWEKLVTWRAGLRRAKRTAADALLDYVSERRGMIRYPEFAAKGSGMRWAADNAEAVMALEALRESDLWQTYWRTLLPATS